jgi:hypothetical protein
VCPKSERAGLDGAGALEAPAVVGDGLREGTLKIADRGQRCEDDFAMLLISPLLFGSEDAELAGESVAPGVEAATALAFGSFGARGMVGSRGEAGLLAASHSKVFHLPDYTHTTGCAASSLRERVALL